ncbi:SpoIIE family protein phosphatase [Streptomyces sp. NBC_01803]|uniref:SpoIIE family protein phosphatase n=1 Tax=Streptomyces sp. NBC_01803 TaxID=2975946 RepID=UPI002DDB160C|nr:SpoIIE family protein phosphatase [Streptomyces sp. NBC_01803]WSA47778.1 SpoIIE family protein phosphatase [Streptomyces sp. NBC_01803]
MPHPGDLEHLPGGPAAVLVLDGRGEVVACTRGVERVFHLSPGRLRGRRLADLLVEPDSWPDLAELATLGEGGHGVVALRRPDGGTEEVRLDVLPLRPDGGPGQLVAVTPAAAARLQEEDQGLIRALFSQNFVGLAIHDADLLLTRVSLPSDEAAGENWYAGGSREPFPLDHVLLREDAHAFLEQLRRVAATGEPVVNWEHSARFRDAPTRERVVALSAFQLQDADECLIGVAALFTDITEQHMGRRRIALLHTAAQRMGGTLDVTRNAEELARILVPDFADLAAVDLADAVFSGDDTGPVLLEAPVRRIAAIATGEEWPPTVHPAGAVFRNPGFADDDRMHRHGVLTDPGLFDVWARAVRPSSPDGNGEDGRDGEDGEDGGGGGDGPELLLLPSGHGTRMVVPLHARGQILGAIALWRSDGRPPFSQSDAGFAEEIGTRAALSVDNARRYTREHRTLETLQRSLLPQPTFEVSAARTAGSYVPAATAAGIGGSWYDVIPLSSARVAFVIGDVAGHGLNATATMGRLRTAVQTLADLDIAPDELLTRLDDLAIRLADTGPAPGPSRGGAVGATCLYCVYDPISGECAMAGAGRVPPVLARPGQRAEVVALKPGPPLGVGGIPFETIRLRIDPGSFLAFFSDELVAHADDPEDDGGEARRRRLRLLSERIAAGAAADGSPSAVGQGVLDALLPGEAPANDVALLVARVGTLPEGAVADWRFPAEPTIVGEARDRVLGQLKDWDLTGNMFPTELIVSELVTNAIRYAGGPVGLRLIRNETLVCEVSDPSETQPHLRRARPTDEGGRGLFLVAQLAHRWGSRYTPSGKTIWTEQLLDQG